MVTRAGGPRRQTRRRTKAAVRIAKILVPTDFSTGAGAALRWAQALAQAFEAKITLLHVLDLRIAALAGLPPDTAAMPAVAELADQARAEARDQMARLAAGVPGARTVIVEGVPRTVIVDAAKDAGADLIVMGTHGRTGLAHMLFGSVAEHVVRHSRVPVLTARVEEPASR